MRQMGVQIPSILYRLEQKSGILWHGRMLLVQ